MLAQNPKTGKPIRIMRSDASIWRSEKTLIWLKDQDVSIPWDRYETMCMGVPDIMKWQRQGIRIDYAVITSATPETADWFRQTNHAAFKMIFIPRNIVFQIGEQAFRAMRVHNVIILEEAHAMYPFLGLQWHDTQEDAAILVASLMRAVNLMGLPEGQSFPRLDILKSNAMMPNIIPVVAPKELWFITQYYIPEKARRAKEIRKCLEMNMKCKCIDKIVLLNEKDLSNEYPSGNKNKIQQEIIGKRLTYKDVIQWIQEKAPNNVLCVFANADIYLDDETWRDVWSIKHDNLFLALLRWDVQENDQPSKIFGPRNDSQDTWMISSDSAKATQWDFAALDFSFGKSGCDNAITVEMLRKKYLVVNPAMSLKTHHLQISNVRNYDPKDIVAKDVFLYVDPTGIHDMEPLFNLAKYVHEKIEYSSFSRELHSVQPKVLDTYCKMLERGERYIWTRNDTNTFKSETVPIYKYENVLQTPQGLVYGYNRLYIGNEEASKEAWAKSQLGSITPAYNVKRSLVVPWISDQVKKPEGYVLYYLSKILWMRNKFGEGEFWTPGKQFLPVLELFKWYSQQVPVIPHSESAQIWCKEAIQYPWMNKQEIHKEEVDALRLALQDGWSATKNEQQKWVVMIDDSKITSDMVREWENTYGSWDWQVVFEGRTAPERIIQKLRGATGFIFYGGSNSLTRWGFSWALPSGAHVIEIQNEMDPNGEAAHVSGAAGLRHSFVIVPRADDKNTKGAIDKYVRQTLDAVSSSSQTQEQSSLPIIRIPRSSLTGFFAHAGDSFREMVRLWEEKGYVRVVEDATAVQIWLGSVGDILLYDRPNLDWLMTAPPSEQKWKFALFGNPKPSDTGGPAASWFFWPRKPRLVEEAVAKKLDTKGWNDRTKTCVFYGKIENKVQERRRLGQDWESVCDEYVCVKGEDTKYPFTPEQYLENLANAKFGLCLAGYGKKCHREVECMAMGCVPIVASDVDMENYANPPEEGRHYLRAATPEEAKAKIAETTPTQWTIMSMAANAWWRENASAEGSWKLTNSLCNKIRTRLLDLKI